MNVEGLKLKTIRSEVHYRGNYTDNAFGLLASPPPLYRSILKHLQPFGVSLQNLKAETGTLADAHLSCVLPDINTAIRVRLDRLEVDFWKFHELGMETANRIVGSVWTAIHEADESVSPSAHSVDLNVVAEVVGGTAGNLIGRYVRLPDALGPMDLGVAFYTPPIQNPQDRWMNLVIDRVFRQERQVLIKLTVGFDARDVSLDGIARAVEQHATSVLDKVGLIFSTETRV